MTGRISSVREMSSTENERALFMLFHVSEKSAAADRTETTDWDGQGAASDAAHLCYQALW